LERKLKDAQSFVSEKNSCIEDLERQNSELATSKKGQAIEIERLNANLEKSQDQVRNLEGKIFEFQELVEQIKTEQEQLQSRNDELHELNQDLIRTKTTLQSEIETAQKNLQTTKEQSQVEISKLQDLILKLSSDLVHLEEAEEYSKNMEEQMVELKSNSSQLQGKVDVLVKEGNALKLRLSQLNKALNTPLGKLFSMLSGL
jgi:chromosome segregation ATPase